MIDFRFYLITDRQRCAPRALQAVDRIGAEARRTADLASMEPGRFTSVGSGSGVVYGESVSADGSMERVFLQRRTDEVVIEVTMKEQVSKFFFMKGKVLKNGKPALTIEFALAMLEPEAGK